MPLAKENTSPVPGPRFGPIGHIADELLVDFAQVDPTAREVLGIESALDLPIPGLAYYNLLNDARQRALNALQRSSPKEPQQVRLKSVMMERLLSDQSLDEIGFTRSLLAPLATMVHSIRETFDNLPHETKEQWDRLGDNLASVPLAMEAYQETLMESALQGHVALRRQVLFAARQCERWVSQEGDDFYGRLVRNQRDDRLSHLATQASEATLRFSAFLIQEILPMANDTLGVGEERYLATAQAFLGTDIDIDETYAFGWEEYERITSEMNAVVRELGFDTLSDATSHLDNEIDARISDPQILISWLQRKLLEVTQYIDQSWFTLHPRVRDLHCYITPASMGIMYYTPPSLRNSRPGTIWWSLPGSGSIQRWRELSTVFHEGVPGHHLQATLATSSGDLHPWQQAYGQVHGYVEGWAHEAERRMYQEGVIETPAERLGSLFAQRWRAARVVIDLGVHLDMPIPHHNSLIDHGSPWTFESAVDALARASGIEKGMASVEVERYLGWPAQALSFSLGAKVWCDQIRLLSQSENVSEQRSIEMLLSMGPMGLRDLARVVSPEGSQSSGSL